MFRRLRTTSFAGFGAVLLALIVSGMVAAASILTAVAAPEPDPVGPAVVDTTQTFEDVNGDGIDDDCQDAVAADPVAAGIEAAAVDTNGDGTISVSEAAQSDRTGGANCNHGGYVNGVADTTCDAADTSSTDANATDAGQAGNEQDPEVNADETSTDGTDATDAPDATDTADAETSDCGTTVNTPPVEPTQDQQPLTCDTAPTGAGTTTGTSDTQTTDTAKNHGAVVSAVAGSTAVGGKNCNHGGAVSEASHKDNEARKAARDAEKAARDAARAAEKAARDAAHAAKHAGKGHGHNH